MRWHGLVLFKSLTLDLIIVKMNNYAVKTELLEMFALKPLFANTLKLPPYLLLLHLFVATAIFRSARTSSTTSDPRCPLVVSPTILQCDLFLPP